jgi:isoquinoline 1-oxidoreductase subunit beta
VDLEAGGRPVKLTLDARRRHPARLLSPGRLPQAARRGRRAGQRRRLGESLRHVRRGQQFCAAGRHRPREFPAGYVPNFHLGVSTMPLGVPTGFLRAPDKQRPRVRVPELPRRARALRLGRIPSRSADLLSQFAGPATAGPRSAPRVSSTPSGCVACSIASPRSRLGHAHAAARQGMGVAFHFSHRGYFAEVVQVTVAHGDAHRR